ncbi:MAG TPA: zinc metalloprotease HtpX [Candidatus Saccharimonadales bacterium]|nr:zinc metalloprotease HtpX [Candidatus Saccharimonadales bacterium]
MNSIKTALLLGLLTALLMFAGGAFGGRTGIVLAFGFAVVMNFGAYWFSDSIVLKFHGARPLEPTEAPEVHAIVATLAQRAGMPMPRIYLVNSPSPNAFATGRGPSHAAVAVTTGILQLMNRDELEGVIAHELSHVRNRDTLTSTVAATLAGAIMMLASMARWTAFFGGFGGRDRDGSIFELLAMALLAPIAAVLIQMGISRSREYQADASGAELAGHPDGLASALRKLGQTSGRIPMRTSPAMSHLYIVNPLSGKSLANLFSTHPPLEARIARLMNR